MMEGEKDWTRMMRFLNLRPGESGNERFVTFAQKVMLELADVGDFIWKVPNFIQAERKLELEKLQAYFPLSGDEEKDKLAKMLRSTRWHLESKKLDHDFPKLVATGNLFTVLAMFEAYCLRLGKLIEECTAHSMQSVKGQGVSRIFKFLAVAGISYGTLPFFEQIDCALKIRNCLIHAEGLLSWSREEAILRKIVQERIFLDKLRRSKVEMSKYPEVAIVGDEIGDRLRVNNGYAFDVVWYAKNFLIAAAEAAHFIANPSEPDGHREAT